MRCDRQIRRLEPLGPRPDLSHAAGACMGPQELINHLNTVRKCRVPVSKSMQRASWHASDSIATGYHILLDHPFSADRTHASTMTSVVAFHVAATCAI